MHREIPLMIRKWSRRNNCRMQGSTHNWRQWLVIAWKHKLDCIKNDRRLFCASSYLPAPFALLPFRFNSLLHIFNGMRMTAEWAIFLRSHPFFQAIWMKDMVTQSNPDFAFPTQGEIVQTHSTSITFAAMLFHLFCKCFNREIHIQFMDPNPLC